jgi:uncharacterized coiled-coil protein SlyX
VNSVEERVAYLDATSKEQAKHMDRLEEALGSLEQRMDRRFERVDARFDQMEARMTRQFHWLVGILVTSLVTMLAILGSVVTVLLRR